MHFGVIPVLFTLIIVTTASSVFAQEEYDLSGHPVYNWVWNEDVNWSNERHSKPAISNQYHYDALVKILNIVFDPTHIYYEPPVSTFDYCDLEQFSKYPKCR